MNRSIYGHGFHRGADIEGGGAADLQTDVMRFMAILAICLVVIFALVQSIPLAPAPVEPEPPQPVVEPTESIPAPQQAEPVAVLEAPSIPEPLPEPVTQQADDPAPEPPPAEEPVQQEGFTLRFESDIALTRLVARSKVGLYALGADRPLRMHYGQGRISFWEASTPNQYHEMESATVPDQVIAALVRTNDIDPTTIRWGVTLPADMQRELAEYLETESGGALVITTSGALRLEP